jgi:exosortase A-associated hydrolase 1
MPTERAIRIECDGLPLVGIVHVPDGSARRGAVIVVGGPQYRVGSHRQFVSLGRFLASQGIAALRFDYRGVGDGVGEARNFLAIDLDIAVAVDALASECPQLEHIHLWGLCDAASAVLFYAHRDPRIAGLVLCNPWVRAESTYAQTIVKDYYGKQLLSGVFWRRLIKGELDIDKSLAAGWSVVRASLARRGRISKDVAASATSGEVPFPERMLAGLESFRGRVLLILSGNDLTAAEFDNLVRGDRRWLNALRNKGAVLRRIPDANHTFSTRVWRDQVAAWTAEWIRDSNAGSDAVVT